MNPRPSWRLIDSGPCAPAWNMAVDEALLDCFTPDAPPVLRLYQWQPAAVSLGRFQSAADVQPPSGAVVVRRLTGGAAIYHREDELTYSVVAPYQLFGGRDPKRAYHAVHDALREGLRSLGVDFESERPGSARTNPRGMCYEQATCYDVIVEGRKLIGSAQRRSGRAFLQHGSIPRSVDPLAPNAISLAELLVDPPDLTAVRAAILSGFQSRICGSFAPESLSSDEEGRARTLMAERYNRTTWTTER